MVKSKVLYRCTNCNNTSLKWLGCCPVCNEWNSFAEVVTSRIKQSSLSKVAMGDVRPAELFALEQISNQTKQRMLSGMREWDRVMGGGILPASFLILSGDPGIGKSTLLLQVADLLSKKVIVFFIFLLKNLFNK